MRTARTAAMLAVFILAGLLVQWLVDRLHVRFSAAVIALVATLLFLMFRKRVDEPVQRGARALQRWFPLFFVPACAGIVEDADVLRGQWLATAAVLVLSTLLGLAAGVFAGSAVLRFEARPR